ncbi:hypothetical protein LINGRAHAP2_LOCUS18313 [Linum grandiflorum]
MARGLSFSLHNDCGGGAGGCMSSSADGGWGAKLMRSRGEKKAYSPSSSSSSSSSSPSSPPYLRTLKIGRGSSEIVGDVFYGTDDAAGIDEYRYKEDVLEHYRKEKERKSVRRKREKRSASWYGAVVDWFRSILCCFR